MAGTTDPQLAEKRRTAILAAAAAEFAEVGFDRARAADIAARAGVSSGTVFYYFTDKATLFRSLFGADLRRNERLREEAFTLPVRDAVGLVISALAETATDPTAVGLLAELIRRIGADPELEQTVAAVDAVARDTLAELISRGQAADQFDGALDPAHAAAFLVSITDGAHLADVDVRPDVLRAAFAYLEPQES